jgi:DNA-binding NarL/FixJ family response regulator
MIRCIAIDDEPLALQQIAAYIGKVPFLELAAQCQSALEAQRFLQSDTVDAIFCDINMPDLNGMDFIKSLAVPPLVVFTTAYAEYAVEGFKVNAVDYLLKPFGLQDFMRAANRLQERLVPPPSLRSTFGRSQGETSHLYAFAFSGIHSFSPRLFPLMDHFPDRFGIIDFYLSVCHRAHIVGLVKPDLDVLDVGKLDTLEQANDFILNSQLYATEDYHS